MHWCTAWISFYADTSLTRLIMAFIKSMLSSLMSAPLSLSSWNFILISFEVCRKTLISGWYTHICVCSRQVKICCRFPTLILMWTNSRFSKFNQTWEISTRFPFPPLNLFISHFQVFLMTPSCLQTASCPQRSQVIFNRQISGVHAEQRKDETSELSTRQWAVVKEPIMRSRGQPEEKINHFTCIFPIMLHTEKQHIEGYPSATNSSTASINVSGGRHTGCILGLFQAIKRLTELKIWASIFFVVFCPVANPPNNHASEEGCVCSYFIVVTIQTYTTPFMLPRVLPVCSLSAQQVCRSRSASIFSTC